MICSDFTEVTEVWIDFESITSTHKMVNKLNLKHSIIKRFVNVEESDDEVEVCGQTNDDDIEVIADSLSRLDTTPEAKAKTNEDLFTDKSEALSNVKVFVRSFGESVERVVAIEGINPFAVTEELDRLISCKNLNQIELALGTKKKIKKTKAKSSESKKSKKPKEKKKLKMSRKKKESDNQTSTATTTDNTEEENEVLIIQEIVGKKEEAKSSDYQVHYDKLFHEGLHRMSKMSKNVMFKCKVCNMSLIGHQLAVEHSQSEEHSKCKFGDHLKGLDALFTIDSERIGDVVIAIKRQKQLSRIDAIEKQNYVNHGIRLKDGVGRNAFVCLNCEMSFESIKEIRKHMDSVKTKAETVEPIATNGGSDQSDVTTPMSPMSTTSSQTPKKMSDIDIKLKNEGIETQSFENKPQFYCIFCNLYIEYKRTVLSHISESRHRMKRRGENLPPIDDQFTIKSDRIGELDVALARRTALRTISPNTKQELTAKGIRLKDGIGSESFVCTKCNLGIDSFAAIGGHVESLGHML